ncbi:MAG: YceI family protein [Gammaproteobacteria bacterium]|nr:MAG: YceI family protein [Gammaproteobacteria bacterium]
MHRLMMLLMFLSGPSLAGWTLDNDASRLFFISIKKTHVAEVHRFRHLAGRVDDDGTARLDIDLNSVDTRVPIRDERMRTMLFETARFPRASFRTRVDAARVKGLKAGEMMRDALEGTLSLHGVEKPIHAPVVIVRLAKDRLYVASLEPVILYAPDFGLKEGIERLRQVVKLPSISFAVPVTFSLVFQGP